MEAMSRELESVRDDNGRVRKDLIVEKRKTDPHNMISSAIAPEQAVASRTRTKVSRKADDLM
jgi:cell shape-determining protein MreC